MGGPAALGMGRLWGLKSGRFVGLGGSLRAVPESNAIMPATCDEGYSPLGLIRLGTKVLSRYSRRVRPPPRSKKSII
jgi:hypothetical protein